MIITVNKVFAGTLDLSALERVEDLGVDKLPFHLIVRLIYLPSKYTILPVEVITIRIFCCNKQLVINPERTYCLNIKLSECFN